jgi:hypothetical protein
MTKFKHNLYFLVKQLNMQFKPCTYIPTKVKEQIL